MIVGADIFDNKTAKNVSSVLEKAINSTEIIPFLYWSDNGLVNTTKEMKKMLEDYGIVLIKTIPGNPQANGKIERFWPEFEKRKAYIKTDNIAILNFNDAKTTNKAKNILRTKKKLIITV